MHFSEAVKIVIELKCSFDKILLILGVFCDNVVDILKLLISYLLYSKD